MIIDRVVHQVGNIMVFNRLKHDISVTNIGNYLLKKNLLTEKRYSSCL